MMQYNMNKEQVTAIFTRYAVLFGDEDGMPERRAVEIFGKDAVEFVHRMASNSKTHRHCYNGYGNGQYTAYYLTLQGAYTAATYNNVTALQHEEAERQEEEAAV